MVFALPSLAALQTEAATFPQAQWEKATPEQVGMDAAKLEAALRDIPGNVFVVRNGYLVAEKGNVSSSVGLYSVGKSFTALVFAALLQGGKVGYDDLVPGSNFPASPKASFRQFLSMTSDYGLDPHSPGDFYAYNNQAVHFYGEHMREAHFQSKGPDQIFQEVFWDVLGRQDPFRFEGMWSGWGKGFHASARDIARVGLLVLREGVWEGEPLVPRSFIRELYRNQIPAHAAMNTSSGQWPQDAGSGETAENNSWNQQPISEELPGNYSFGWWTNASLQYPDVPQGTVYASGYKGNMIIVCPEYDLVVAKTGTDQSHSLDMNLVLGPILAAVNEEAAPTPTPTQAPKATFADVPPDHPYYDEIEALYEAGYTAGCGTDPLRYCPDHAMTRAESAVFVERGVRGVKVILPEPESSIFEDMEVGSWGLKWATVLYQDGYSAGCAVDPLRFCPDRGHTRAEGAVFYLRMLHGIGYTPPDPQGVFTDVALSAWHAKWDEEAFNQSLIPACSAPGEPLRFCPDDPLTRSLAAYMLVQAKGLLPKPTPTPTDGPAVVSFTLIDADTDQPVLGFDPLQAGDTLDLASLPTTRLNVRANTIPATVGSVRFDLDGASNIRTENASPYALAGDLEGDYNAWTPSLGAHTLSATPYTGRDASGMPGTSLSLTFSVTDSRAEGVVSGELRQWYPLTLSFRGPLASELDEDPDPFLDYRLQASLVGPSGRVYEVPGFFDGDGNGHGRGDVWRLRFTPDEAGEWTYRVSFRAGENLAVDPDPQAGAPTAFDGLRGSFTVQRLDLEAPGFMKWGRLEYIGGHYLKFRDGPYWLKGGANSPENLLAYVGFDGTRSGSSFGLHTYAPHQSDWKPGDPDWGGGLGQGIIGALNYLASQQVNAIYFLPLNIGGDGKDTWPFAGTIQPQGDEANDDLHYDISKLDQWEKVFDHAQRLGIQLHVVLNEAEEPNKRELDDATLGVERKLFYRELIARFSHHNALQWNISEEYDSDWAGALALSPQQVKTWAGFIQGLDPYDHPITVHNARDPDSAWTPFLGDARFSLTSFQYSKPIVRHGDEAEEWRRRTESAGRPIPIHLDELRATTVDNIPLQRKEILWPVYFSGGAGVEWYLGEEDQSLEDFRRYEDLWRYTRYARAFMQEHLPFWEMTPGDDLLEGASTDFGGGQVFFRQEEVYAIYLPKAANTGSLNLSQASGAFQLRWYNPRTGQFEGAARTVTAGARVSLGPPPHSPTEDWVVLLQRV